MAVLNPYNYSKPNNHFRLNNENNKEANINPIKPKNKSDSKYDSYKEQAILTAPPEELTLMLYDGAVKFLKKAKIHIEQKDIENSNNALLRAQDIIVELNSTLNMDYDISNNLRDLYDFMTRRITDANIEKDCKIIDEVLGLVIDLRDTWKEAMKLAKAK